MRASFYTLQKKQRNISNAVHIFHLTRKNSKFREARSIAPSLPALSSANRAATALFSMRKAHFWKNDSMAVERCVAITHGIAVFLCVSVRLWS